MKTYFIIKHPLYLIALPLLFTAPRAFPAAEPLSCADRSIVAGTVRTTIEVEALVQCAYEFVQEVGFDEAYRAFHEEERWRKGPIYIFVTEIAPIPEAARPFVFPPDASREGLPWGLLIDTFGNEFYRELQRIVNDFGEG